LFLAPILVYTIVSRTALKERIIMAQSSTTSPTHGVRSLTVAVVALWFLLALGGSLLGVFDSEPRPPIPLGLATVVPVAAFVSWYLTSARFREFVSSLDLRMLTLAQTWRVGGIVFIILYLQGALPGVFALPAGWGDIAIGITAPVMAWYWRPPFPRKTFVVWNVLGSLDLVNAVSLGVLASATPVGVLAGEVTTRLMGQFPLSLIPTFFVPLLLIFHLICLVRVGKGVA
jgi:hypothetical protein